MIALVGCKLVALQAEREIIKKTLMNL